MPTLPTLCPYCGFPLGKTDDARALCTHCLQWVLPIARAPEAGQAGAGDDMPWPHAERDERCIAALRDFHVDRTDYASERTGLRYTLQRAPTALEIAESLLRQIEAKRSPQGFRLALFAAWITIRRGCGAEATELQRAFFLEQTRQWATEGVGDGISARCPQAEADASCAQRCGDQFFIDALQAPALPCGKAWCSGAQARWLKPASDIEAALMQPRSWWRTLFGL